MSEHIILLGAPDALLPTCAELETKGYTVKTSGDWTEALQWVDSLSPAALLVDLAIENSVALCGLARSIRHTMTIIAFDDDTRQKHASALNAGADVVLQHPVNPQEVHWWLKTPRTSAGHLLPLGALLGHIPEAVISSAELLAHDLKSPISTVISTLEVVTAFAENGDAPNLNVRLLRGALHAAYRQMYLLLDVIDLAQLELDNYVLKKEPVDLTVILQGYMREEKPVLESKGLAVEVQLAEAPLWTDVDMELMPRVISALVDNTVKFTILGDRLVIRTYEDAGSVALSFSDSGRPILPGHAQDLMKRAPQWESRLAGSRTSVAMGLPFIHTFARVHGGSFIASTDPATEMTTFTLRLPLASPPAPPAES